MALSQIYNWYVINKCQSRNRISSSRQDKRHLGIIMLHILHQHKHKSKFLPSTLIYAMSSRECKIQGWQGKCEWRRWCQSSSAPMQINSFNDVFQCKCIFYDVILYQFQDNVKKCLGYYLCNFTKFKACQLASSLHVLWFCG